MNLEELQRLAAACEGKTLAQVANITSSALLSDHDRAVLAAHIKREHVDADYTDIFAALQYHPEGTKSILAALGDFHEVMSAPEESRVRLGWPKLDNATRGIRPGQVMGLMARAGVGKTMLAVNIIHNQQGRSPILFFSLEMSAGEIAQRMFCIEYERTVSQAESWFAEGFSRPEFTNLQLKYPHLFINEQYGLTLDAMHDIYVTAMAEVGCAIPLVIIDYLGLVRPPDEGSHSSYERVSAVARGLKDFAKDVEAAVLVLVQSSRKGEDGKKALTLDMARDSGAVEEAADFMLGCWRLDGEGEGGGEPEGTLGAALLKNRQGPLAECKLFFDYRTLRITEVD